MENLLNIFAMLADFISNVTSVYELSSLNWFKHAQVCLSNAKS